MANERLVLTIEPTESDADGLPTFSLDELNEHKGKFLGRGAFGKVYAINSFPGLAMKEIWLRGQQDRLKEITKFELEALSRFSHLGVLKYHQVIEDGDFFYIIMDRYDGDLNKFIVDHKRIHEPISRELLLSIMRQLADALAYVHAPYKVNEKGDVLPGIVHRDLKPENVLISKDGNRFVLADFGLCKDVMHDGNTLAGTPSYMAPEVFIHSKTSRASDIWAFGVIIYELVTLERPSFSHHWEPKDAEKFFVDGWKPDLSAIEDAFVKMILEKIFVLDPIERPTAGDIVSLLQVLSISAAPPPEVPTFTLSELNRCRGQFLGGGVVGKVYAINGFPGLAVKEIYLNGQPDRLKEITKFELEALSRFSHLGVLKYHQVIEDGDFFYIIMDRYDGDLNKFIVDHKRIHEPISRELLLSIMKQLVDALVYVHDSTKVDANGSSLPAVVHRDIKPANVLMSRDGERVVIADFGLCKDAQHDGNTLAGTPSYMAPEVFIHSKTSRASDIWSLGVIIYELVTLERPNFLCDNEPRRVFVDGWRPDLSAVEDEFIKSILEKIFILDPKKRPTAGDIAILFQTPSTSASEPGAQNSLLDEKHEPRTALDDINSKASSSWTPLMRAAAAGDIRAVKKHLSKKSKKDNRKDMALIIAARAGHEKIVELLDPTDKNGVTALMQAAEEGDVEAVRALMPLQKRRTASYVKIGKWEIYGGTALMMAGIRGHAEVVRSLVEHEGSMQDSWGWTALMLTARSGHMDCIKLLLEKEACMQNKDGWSALMLAAVWGHEQIVEVLTEEGGLKNNSHQTALMFAARNNRTGCVKLFLEKEVGIRDNQGWTALMWAAQQGHKEVVKILLEHEKGIKDKQGHNALYHALKHKHTEVAEIIIPHENPTDENGVTALMRAAARGDAEMVELLIPLQKGMKDKDGNMAFIHALKNKHVDVATVLRKQEAPSWTLLMCAAFIGDIETVKHHLWRRIGYKQSIDKDVVSIIAAKAGHEDIVELLNPTDSRGITALMRAAEEGDVEAVRALIPLQKKRKADYVKINGWETYEGTALMMAAAHGHADVVELLAGHEGGMKDSDGWTALMIASRNGYTECIKLLLEKESGIQDKYGMTALMRAVVNNNLECARLLAEKERGIQDNNSMTALMIAAQRGCKETVKVLLEHEKGAKDKDGNTAFMHALKNSHVDAALLLREYEAPSWTPLMCATATGDIDLARSHLSDKDKKNGDGDTALMIAARAGHADVVELLDPTDRDGVTALMRAAERNDVEAVKALIPLQKGKIARYIKINELEMYEGTALMVAAVCGNTEVVRLLVEHEGDMRDSEGWTALMHAVACGHADCARLLVSKEAGMQDEDGRTALMLATENNRVDCVKLLLGKESGIQKNGGATSLIIAVARGHAECAKLLLKKEADMQDNANWTALMFAAQKGHTECISLLLEKEGGMQDVKKQTALMKAANSGHIGCVKLLLEKEARMKDNCDQTALIHAARAGHREAAEILMEHEKDVTGWTMLMCAAALGDVEMVSQHLDEKCQKDKQGQTALILAAKNGRDEAVKFLVKHENGVSSWTSLIYGAYLGDVDAVKNNIHEKGCKDVTEMTALMWAAQRGFKEIVEVLLEDEKGMKDNQNHSSLYYALKSGHMEVAEVIIPHEDPTDENGVTALMRAAERGDVEAVRALVPLQKGRKTNTNYYGWSGETALMRAASCGCTEVVRLLVEHEGGMRDSNGWTALMVATYNGHVECVKLLARKEKNMKTTRDWCWLSPGTTALDIAKSEGRKEIVSILSE